jgi:hypothetical protein
LLLFFEDLKEKNMVKERKEPNGFLKPGLGSPVLLVCTISH